MAKLERIRELLRAREMRFAVSDDEDTILVPFSSATGSLTLKIDPQEVWTEFEIPVDARIPDDGPERLEVLERALRAAVFMPGVKIELGSQGLAIVSAVQDDYLNEKFLEHKIWMTVLNAEFAILVLRDGLSFEAAMQALDDQYTEESPPKDDGSSEGSATAHPVP